MAAAVPEIAPTSGAMPEATMEALRIVVGVNQLPAMERTILEDLERTRMALEDVRYMVGTRQEMIDRLQVDVQRLTDVNRGVVDIMNDACHRIRVQERGPILVQEREPDYPKASWYTELKAAYNAMIDAANLLDPTGFQMRITRFPGTGVLNL